MVRHANPHPRQIAPFAACFCNMISYRMLSLRRAGAAERGTRSHYGDALENREGWAEGFCRLADYLLRVDFLFRRYRTCVGIPRWADFRGVLFRREIHRDSGLYFGSRPRAAAVSVQRAAALRAARFNSAAVFSASATGGAGVLSEMRIGVGAGSAGVRQLRVGCSARLGPASSRSRKIFV